MTEDMSTFKKRINRVDPDFEPTLARKWKMRPRRKLHIPLLKFSMVVVFTYATLTTTKIVMEKELGPDGFDAKVARLEQGSDTSKIAAKLLWRDPVMAYVQKKI